MQRVWGSIFLHLQIPVPSLKVVRGRILNTVQMRHGASECAFSLSDAMDSSYSLAKQSTQWLMQTCRGDYKRLSTAVVLSSPILGRPLKSRMPCR